MKRTNLVAVAALCALILFATSANAQDSQSCVELTWGKTFTFRAEQIGDTLHTKAYLFTNNCDWDVIVYYRPNDFGQQLCGRLTSIRMKSGDRRRNDVYRFDNDPKAYVTWCAEASDSTHSDFQTCSIVIRC